MMTVVIQPNLTVLIGAATPRHLPGQTTSPPLKSVFATEAEQKVAQVTVNVIKR